MGQVALGVGVAAAGIYGLHQLITPRVTGWVTHMRASRAAAAQAEAQRIAALTAALESLAAGQARLQDTLNLLQAALDKQQHQQAEGYRLPADPAGRVGGGSEVVRSSHSEYLRCQSPGAAAQQNRQYSYTSASALEASRAAMVRGWDPYDASRSQQSTAAGPAISSRSTVLNGYGPPDGFEVMPRHLPPAAGPADTHSSAAAGGMTGRGASQSCHASYAVEE